MYSFNFINELEGKNSFVLGRKHPLVSISKTLFSSMSNPAFYYEYNHPKPSPIPEPVDPNLYSNLNTLLAYYGLNGSNVEITSNSHNIPFWELLYQDVATGTFYDYGSEFNSLQNIDPSNYLIEQPAYVSAIIDNGKRFQYYYSSYVISDNVPTTDNFPATKQIPFLNNEAITSTLKLIATLDSLTTTPYIEKTVNRTSCFVYTPNSTCFLLINYNESENIKKIYCMQTWTNSTFAELNPTTNMFYLNTYLSDPDLGDSVLPPYWSFMQCTLDDVSMIALFSNPSMNIYAKVVTDGLGNNYQYIRPEEAPFLYDSL